MQNNFTAAVEAGRIQMRVPDSELESYRTADIQRNLGIRPANLTPQVTNISALPNRAELTALYQTERWHSSGTHLWLFTRRNWWWGIPTLIICVYFVWRTLNNWTAKAMGYDKSQLPLKDPEEEYEKFQEHERIRLLQEYKQCPRCGTPLLRTTLVCPSCGLGVCRCGGVIHPGTRQCQQCGATFTMGCPQCGSPIQFDQYYCEKCGAKFCVECSGIIDISTMKCTRCGETYQRICSECNTANDPETVVCKKCGNRLL